MFPDWRSPLALGRDKCKLSLDKSVDNPVPSEFLQMQLVWGYHKKVANTEQSNPKITNQDITEAKTQK